MAAIALVDAHSKARGSARSVLNRLAYRAQDGTNLAWPGTAELARATGYSTRQVKRALAELAAAGEIVRQGSRGRRAVYLVTPDAPHQTSLFTPEGCQLVTLPAETTGDILSTKGDTYARAGSKDRKDINGTPQPPKGGLAPDLVTAWGTSTRRRRRGRGQHPASPPPGEPCPGRHDLDGQWAAIADALRARIGESQFEVWFPGAHLHLLDELAVFGVHTLTAGWVAMRFGRALAAATERPVKIVGCAALGNGGGRR